MTPLESELDPRKRWAHGRWGVESFESALLRLPPFGKRFFELLFEEFPQSKSELRFLSWSVQPEDIYAIDESRIGGFGVQVDPSLEYLIVWGQDGQAEYGDWCGDQVLAALDHVRRLISGGMNRPSVD